MKMLDRINELLAQNERFCLATVLTSIHTDIAPGKQIIIRSRGSLEGEIGNSDIERCLVQNAVACFEQNRKTCVEIEPGMLVFFDLIARSTNLIICGAGHIAVPLARYACDVGFGVTVIDDREDFANPGRFPGCDTFVGEFITELSAMSFGPSTYVVVITRGHEHDTDCLFEVLRHETGYVGLIGSRRRIGFVLEMLGRKGIPKHRLLDVFTPIGIPIGGESPEELAIAIVAELVCVRRKGSDSARTFRESMEI